MEVFSIGTAQPTAAVRADLASEMDQLHRQGLAFKLYEENLGVYSFVDCQFDQDMSCDRENQARILRYYIGNVITDLLLNSITKETLSKMIKANYGCFTLEERQTILDEAAALLNQDESRVELPPRIVRRNQILSKILRHLESQQQIVLEGFLRFQLKEYFNEIRDALDRSVDRFMLEKEYREFIRLFRYFVEIQAPRIEEVNVRVKGGGMFSLLDEDGHAIEHEQLRDILTDLGPEEIDYEDLLLSALITIAPARVVLHIIDPLEVVNTIKLVFEDRVVICPGCSICRKG